MKSKDQRIIMNALEMRQKALEIGILPISETNWKSVVKKAIKDEAHANRFGSPKRQLKIERDFYSIVSIRTAFGTSVSSEREFAGSFENTQNLKGFIPISIGSLNQVKRKRDGAMKQFHTHPGQHRLSRTPSKTDMRKIVALSVKRGQPAQEVVVSIVNRQYGIGATSTTVFTKDNQSRVRQVHWNPFAKETFSIGGDVVNVGTRVSILAPANENQYTFQKHLVRLYTDYQKSSRIKGRIIPTRTIAIKLRFIMSQVIREFYLNG